MAEPRVPGGGGTGIDLPCGETVSVHDLDMGLREFDCRCGEAHAVVMDIHPLGRFVPESMADVLRATIEPADDFEEFTTAHLLGMVLEEFPDAVVAEDVSEDGDVGYTLVWVAEFDARRLHEVVVELLVELMEHAMSHAEDDEAMAEFESQMLDFDVAEFVETYRAQRDFESEHDSAV
ncbi:DUF5815 family protein [Halorientalis litorea]|jgi:hypothetical protein|uniref:DUF5815 family protein n=1 Tax=Halorientalis litorea TaxID=2931977 RepID=UPI001FF1CCAA|nr:DUF5815 family protein [Halorientalis litorea]